MEVLLPWPTIMSDSVVHVVTIEVDGALRNGFSLGMGLRVHVRVERSLRLDGSFAEWALRGFLAQLLRARPGESGIVGGRRQRWVVAGPGHDEAGALGFGRRAVDQMHVPEEGEGGLDVLTLSAGKAWRMLCM